MDAYIVVYHVLGTTDSIQAVAHTEAIFIRLEVHIPLAVATKVMLQGKARQATRKVMGLVGDHMAIAVARRKTPRHWQPKQRAGFNQKLAGKRRDLQSQRN